MRIEQKREAGTGLKSKFKSDPRRLNGKVGTIPSVTLYKIVSTNSCSDKK